MKKLITVQKNNYSWKELPAEELRKEITQSAYLPNSVQKFIFPSTDAYLHPENQSQISISQEILKIKEYSNLTCCENALTCPF